MDIHPEFVWAGMHLHLVIPAPPRSAKAKLGVKVVMVGHPSSWPELIGIATEIYFAPAAPPSSSGSPSYKSQIEDLSFKKIARILVRPSASYSIWVSN